MAVTLYEKVESRTLSVDRNTGAFTARFLAVGSPGEVTENEVYQAAVLDTTVAYFGTLFRSAISVKERPNRQYWDVEITYSPIPPREAIQNPGLDGGAGPDQPQAPDPGQPIGPGYSFTTIGGNTKIYQSIKTISVTQSLEAIAAGKAKQDFHGAINVVPNEGAQGTEIVSRNGEFQIEVRRNNVTFNYYASLFYTTGTVNAQLFYGFAAGEVLYLGAEGRFSLADMWQITHKFAVEPNRQPLVVARDQNGAAQITVPAKKGWEYLWVSYYEKHVPDGTGQTYRALRPWCAFVEQVYETGNFGFLEIGQ